MTDLSKREALQGAGMVQKINIKDFRLFQDFTIDGLTSINMIVGENGVGKTALLEAIAQESIPKVHLFLAGISVNGSELADIFTKVEDLGRIDDVKADLREIFPFIKDIKLRSESGHAYLVAEVIGHPVPLALGLVSNAANRSTGILMTIAKADNSVVLVDEIENGIFHRHLRVYAKKLIKRTRANNSQLIATTHSLEWLEKFLEAAGDKTTDIAFWRLTRSDDAFAPWLRRMTFDEFKTGLSMGEMR